MSKICCIIPMYNFANLTEQCIKLTLANAGVPVQILVVDDGSEIPFTYNDDRVNILRLDKNSGYTNATNQGILKCGDRFDYLHLLNNDTEPKKDFIKLLLEALQKDPKLGVACSARHTLMNNEMWYELFATDLISGWQGFNKDIPNEEIIYAAWIPVCSALIPYEVIRYVGLLDPRMRNHCSDNDWCIRCNVAGYKVGLVPKSIIYHIHEVTTKSVKANACDDQNILLQKTACHFQSSILNQLPLDKGSNLWGKLEFTTYTKELVCSEMSKV